MEPEAPTQHSNARPDDAEPGVEQTAEPSAETRSEDVRPEAAEATGAPAAEPAAAEPAAAEPAPAAAEPESAAEAEPEPQAEPAEAEDDGPKLRWYAVHTYSGHENKARLSLLDRIRTHGLQEKFGEILIPTESVVEVVKGQRRTTTRKFYPGYMFVQMVLDDHTYHLVKNTPKITGFLGDSKGSRPVPVRDDEIAGINRQMSEGAIKPKPRINFEEGENVRVTDGPFSNFNGIVEEVRPEKQKVRVLVSIFGRATPIELDFGQVEKA